jgi:type IV secretory pathway VirB2 component (pilin)
MLLKKNPKIFLFLLIFSFILFAGPANAAERSFLGGPLVTCQDNCTFCDLLKTANNIIEFLREVAVLLVILGIVFGGLTMMLAGGNENQFKKGKKIIWDSLIGLVIVLAVWVFVDTLITSIASGKAVPPWHTINCN